MAEVKIHLSNTNKPFYEAAVRANVKHKQRVIGGHQSKHAETVAVIGAGPSLGTDAGMLRTRVFNEVWACNRALQWLLNNDYPVTHAIWVDPGPAWQDEWKELPDVHYYVSTSAQPGLLDHLAAHNRRFNIFHNWIGIVSPDPDWKCPLPAHATWEYETWLYATLYPSAPCVGAGLNVVNRALALALFKGFRHITVIGADCATRSLTGAPMPAEGENSEPYKQWVRDQQMYPVGNVATMAATNTHDVYGADAALIEGIIDGRPWACRPDMLISAINLVNLKKEHGHIIELVGDTLPNALVGKDAEFMAKLPQLGADSSITGLVPRGTDADATAA